MIKFKSDNKGRITQYFGGSPANNPTQYTTRGQKGHSGVDSTLGWDKPIPCDNDGFVYKTITSSQSKENWQGVYMIVSNGDETVEVCQGHFNKILVNPNSYVLEGSYIGLEGNKGYVFSNGVQITPAMQQAGDKRGAHLHTSYRPVKKVKKTLPTEYYLSLNDGTKYKDRDGNYYQIINKDNGYNGCVNPYIYLHNNTNTENLGIITRILQALKLRK